MKFISLLLILMPSLALAQSDHVITSHELTLMPSYLQQRQAATFPGFTDPPSSPVRASAEWEEIDMLVITWTSFPAILTQIVAAAQNETKVLIVCSDSNAVKSTLTMANVPLLNVDYLIAPFNSIWCRDYGQWNVYTNDVDSLALIDWIYNRPRPKDDTVPFAVQGYSGLPIYHTTTPPYDLVHTGGNFMCDGFGTGFSSNLILTDNPGKQSADIDTIMKKFMGIERYIKMNTLPYDQIHHIDMHMKLLDEETLLVGEYPAGIADGPQIEANLQFVLSNFNSVFGTPYKIIRMPMPPDGMGNFPGVGDYRTYTNSVFVNKTLIVPVYNAGADSTALRIYREALPGYHVVGIDCNSIIPSLGAIHCITKEVASSDPLLISHQALHDTYNTTTPYSVMARIQHRSGISQAWVHFRTDTLQPWQAIPMNNSSGYNWLANIPAQAAESEVYYYIEAQSASGKMQVRPITSPAGWWKFNVLLNTGLTDHAEDRVILQAVFPNPSHGITCIPVDLDKKTHVKLVLKNVLGETNELIYDGMQVGEHKYFVNTSSMSPGVYVIELQTDQGRQSQTIIVH